MNFWHVLTMVFVVAKIFHLIDWSWSVVFWPLYVWAGAVAVAVICKQIEDSLS